MYFLIAFINYQRIYSKNGGRSQLPARKFKVETVCQSLPVNTHFFIFGPTAWQEAGTRRRRNRA
jgi:hypothetical protein